MKKAKNVRKYLNWLIINIIIPLLPVLLKILICIFADHEKIIITILDSSELLYYNFFICIMFLNLSFSKDEVPIYETILRLIICMVLIVDLGVIMLIYTNLESTYICKIASVLLSIIIPITVSVYYYSQEDLEK